MNNPKIIFEIGNSSIKLIEMSYERAKDKVMLKNCSIIPLSDSSTRGNINVNTDIISSLIKSEVKKKGIKVKEAMGVISGEGIISRDVLIPKMSEHEIDKKIREESSLYIPVDVANYVIDYKIMNDIQTEEGPKTKIYIVAVPHKMVDTYVEIASKCGFILEAIDINGNAFSKLLLLEMKNRNELPVENDAIVGLDIGAKDTYIVFIQNGIFQFSREINFGCNELINILSENLSLPFEKAEEELRVNSKKYLNFNENLPSMDEETALINEYMLKKLNIFVNELNKIISFYKGRYLCRDITRIYIAGGTSNIEDLDEFIKNNTHLECSKLSQLKCLQNGTKDQLSNEFLSLANVIGTSIRE